MESISLKKGKKIVAFTLYSAFERVLIVLSGMITLIIIGRLGKEELAGGSIANTIITIFQVPFLSLGTAAMISVSADEKAKRKITINSLCVGLIISVFLFLFLDVFGSSIVEVLFAGTKQHIKDITSGYLDVYKWSILFVAIDLVTSGCMRGWKNARTPMVITIAGNLLSIAFSVFFVFYMELGYIGGAYAIVTSSAIVCALKIICLSKLLFLEKEAPSQKSDFTWMKQIFSKSIPFCVNLFFVRIGFLGMHVVTALLGTEVLVGYQVASNILSILYAVTGGVEVSVIAFVSEYYAKKDVYNARRIGFSLSVITTVLLSLLGIVIALYTPFFAQIFNSDIKNSAEALSVVRLMCITIPFTSFFQCVQGIPNAVKHAKTVALSTILCVWCLRIPVAYILIKYFCFGFAGLFIGFMADYMTRSFFYGILSKKLLKSVP